jgi:hypothetical protein
MQYHHAPVQRELPYVYFKISISPGNFAIALRLLLSRVMAWRSLFEVRLNAGFWYSNNTTVRNAGDRSTSRPQTRWLRRGNYWLDRLDQDRGAKPCSHARIVFGMAGSPAPASTGVAGPHRRR